MIRTRRPALVVLVLLGASVCVRPSSVSAQAVGASEAPRAELTFSGALIGPARMGQSVATYTRSDGTPFTLFSTSNSTRPGFGAEVLAGRRVSRTVGVEAGAGWSRATLRSRVSGDAEDSAPPAIDEALTRITAEGALVWTFSARGPWSYFARGGAGIMRELAGDGVYVVTGQIGNAGVGMKYLRRGAAGGRALGLRLEGRLNVRLHGIALGTSSTVVAPVISGGVMFGF